MKIWVSAFLSFFLWSGVAGAETCRPFDHDGQGYALCEVAAGADLRLYLNIDDGAVIGTFDRLRSIVETGPRRLRFAMNAGMYHSDRRPVGLYVEDGHEVARLVTSAGPGNFGLQPNGVFCIRPGGFAVIETLTFAKTTPECRFATQSGPMLVIGGALHPRFLKDSDSLYLRNGVGVSADGNTAYFLISDGRVNFHEFARAFRDGLGVPNALYFDGNISRLYAPELGRDDVGFPMGPMVGLTTSD
ncbi:MAG: phosphodiester glycosidase family protein [Albidovulum sp.]